ncbi:uncharacterized protein LOC112493938 [Cephus cinctus]|uniref:Uncharacterized protein LOC112493938 n=1 Tax=Cephus cinctus TaxID=211228 RepID=A0AAJ7RCB2_CEPCN|nr:uncharacterized protein LOC112493938 [Cephus cinctus]
MATIVIIELRGRVFKEPYALVILAALGFTFKEISLDGELNDGVAARCDVEQRSKQLLQMAAFELRKNDSPVMQGSAMADCTRIPKNSTGILGKLGTSCRTL